VAVEDIAVLTGGSAITEDLGQAKKVTGEFFDTAELVALRRSDIRVRLKPG